MRIHFIAIGGAAMHNLAIALNRKGMKVTGSDDEIFEPSKGRIAKYGLLPEEFGWFPEKITADIDAIILGMHARIDNPELIGDMNVPTPYNSMYIFARNHNWLSFYNGLCSLKFIA